MKKLILALAVTAFSINVHAQSDSVHKKMTPTDRHNLDEGKTQNHDLIVTPDQGTKNNPDPVTGKPLQVKTDPDGYMVKDGKMMMIVNGKFEQMQTEMTLSNGTIVMTDGYFKTKDGSKTRLMEGQLLDLNGQVVPRK